MDEILSKLSEISESFVALLIKLFEVCLPSDFVLHDPFTHPYIIKIIITIITFN